MVVERNQTETSHGTKLDTDKVLSLHIDADRAGHYVRRLTSVNGAAAPSVCRFRGQAEGGLRSVK